MKAGEVSASGARYAGAGFLRRRAHILSMLWFVAVGGLALATALAGYQQIFSTFAPYDDEGYVMLSVAQYLRGLPLYEEVYTQYGPALFVAEGGFHRVTGLPITHDVVRLRTLAMWLATAALAGLAARRLSGSALVGLIAFLLGFFHLDRFCLEPGHPQELCGVAIMAAILLASYLPQGAKRGWIPLGLGVVVGVALMTKFNVGLFLLASMTGAFVLAAPTTWPWPMARGAVGGGAALLPLAVTWEHLDTAAGWRLPAVVLSGWVGLGLTRVWLAVRTRSASCESPDDPSRSRSEVAPDDAALLGRAAWWFFAGVMASCTALAAVVLAQGVSVERLGYGLIGQHRGFAGPFYHPAPLSDFAIAAAIGGAAAAWWAAHNRVWACVPAWGIAAVLVAAGLVQYFREAATPLAHGLNDRGGAGWLVAFATPWVWMVLWPRRSERRVEGDAAVMPINFGRLALGAVAALQPLGAYPVPGTQMAVASLPLLVLCLVALSDAGAFARQGRGPQKAGRGAGPWGWGWSRLGLIAPAILLFGSATALAYREVSLWRYRESLVPLALPGADRLRAAPEVAEEQRAIVQALRQRAETFVFGEYARNSFYFWAGVDPPTALNATVWPYLLRPEQQRRIVGALHERRGVWLVREPFAARLPEGETPLADYLAEHFRQRGVYGRFQLWSAIDEP